MNAKFTVTANPRLREAHDALIEFNKADMDTMLDWVDSEFAKNMKQQFATEGASGGARWTPLSPEYSKQKQRKKPGRKILTFTGKLRKSLTNRRSPDHVAYHTRRPRPTLFVGTNNKVAAYHSPDEGGNPYRPNPKLPVRDPLQHTAKQENTYLGLCARYIIKYKAARYARFLAAGARQMQGGGSRA